MKGRLPWKKLGDCCTVVSGATPRRDTPEYWGGDIAWVTPKDLSSLKEPVLHDTPEKITAAGLKSCSTTLLPKGSILFSSRAPIGLVAIAGRKMCTNQGFKSLIPGKGVDSGYLYWCMRQFTPQIEHFGRGATFKEVSKNIIEEFEIPLPPPPEQRRIAVILDKADAIRRKHRGAIRLIDELFRSTFLDFFGDPITNPMNWPMGTIGDLASAVQYGTSAKAGSNGASKILRMGNITYEGGWDFSDMKFIDLAPDEVQRYSVNKGEVLFNRTNSRELVGKTAVFREEEPMIYAGYLVKLTVNDRADGEYVGAVMNTRSMKAYLRAKCKNIIGMANINASEFKAIPVPIPPIKLQKKFACFVHKTLRARERLISALQEADTLFSAIESRAFKGAL